MTYAAPHTYGGSTAIAMAMAERRGTVLCDLETYRCPRTVLLKERLHVCRAPVSFRLGRATVLVVKSDGHNFPAKGSDVAAWREESSTTGAYMP